MRPAALRRSSASPRSASARSSASRIRTIADGCTVATTCSANPVSAIGRPRSRVTRNDVPRSACAAVAPSRTSTRGSDDLELSVEPWAAGGDLHPIRLVVDAALAACPPLEVLDGIRHVHPLTIDARGAERFVEHATRGADEWPAGEILPVTGLFADEHQLRILADLRRTPSAWRPARGRRLGSRQPRGRGARGLSRLSSHVQPARPQAGKNDSPQQPQQGSRVSQREALPVVVEEGVDVAPTRPTSERDGPIGELAVGVIATTAPRPIVEAHEREIRGRLGALRAGRAGPVADNERDTVLCEKLEWARSEPALMPELDRVAEAGWERGERAGEAVVVAGEGRRQLPEKRPSFPPSASGAIRSRSNGRWMSISRSRFTWVR